MNQRIRYRRLLAVLPSAILFAGIACSSSGEPTPLPTATTAPLPTASATATAMPVPTLTATATSVPSPTPTVVPTQVPTSTPTPSPTPVPTADPRYGLIVTSDDTLAFELFGSIDYIDYSLNLSDVPPGARKVLYTNSVNPVPVEAIREAAAAAPGSVWYILGEPNAHGVSVQDVLVGLHDTYAAIKEADPTALITSPSILNFSFNCIGCPGFAYGSTWISNFFHGYIELFGEEPPIDIWAIDVFPIVWPGGNLSPEEAFPTVRDDIVAQQVLDFREWLDARESTRGAPIWVTEFGLHWGFEGWEFGVEGCNGQPSPTGEYLLDEVQDYLVRAYTWFEENSESLNLERWFTFATYRDISRCTSDSGNGLSFLDNSGTSGKPTELGEFYKDWVRGVR